jgi:hypothetical protein
MASEDNRVARPAAGLPPLEAFLLRRVLFPAYCRFTSWDKAAAVFEAEGKKLIALARPLSSDLFQKKVLIRPLCGLEDGSRGWSAEMVLEHLIEVGTHIAIRIVELSQGEKPRLQADAAGLEPMGGQGLRRLEDYIAFSDDYAKTLQEDVGDRRGKLAHPHPWLGPLTAHGWACLGAVHQTVHRRQMQRIVAGLQSRRSSPVTEGSVAEARSC